MPKIKLTEKIVKKLEAPTATGKQQLHWDAELTGFGVLCSGVTSSKSYVVQRDLPGGRTRRLTLAATNVLGLDAARARAQEILADLYRGIDPKRGRLAGIATLRQTLDDYIAANNKLRAKSQHGYRYSVEKYLGAWLDLPLRDITREMVEARHAAIAAQVAAGGRGKGEVTANGAMKALKTLWKFAADDRVPDLPPCPVRLTKRQWFAVPRRKRMVTDEQLPAFYAAVQALPNPVQRDYLLLLLFTGMRREEAAGLRWEHVDLPKRVMRLPAERVKGNRDFSLPMSDIVHDLLVARRAVGNEAGWVFPADSAAGYIAEPKYPLRLVAEATGIRVSPHDLRRTFATAAESVEISPVALKALLNHAIGKSDVTEGYIIVATERLRVPVQRVADRLKHLCGIAPVTGCNVVRHLG